MFKFQSVAYGLFISITMIVLVPIFATAEDAPSPVVVGESPATVSLREAAQARREGANACSTTYTEFNSAKADVVAACTAVPNGSGESSGLPFLDCLTRINCCFGMKSDECETGASSDVHAGRVNEIQQFLDTLNDQMSSASPGSPQMTQLETSQAQARSLQSQIKMYQSCPMRSSVDLDKAYEEAEEAREKVEEREESINELKQQIIEAQQKLEEDKQKIEADQKELELKTQTDIKEIQDQQEDAMRQLLEQIEAQESRKRELLGMIGEQENQKTNAYDAMMNKITELKVACYQEGVKKAQETRAKILQKAANNQYSAGSLQSLYKSVGSSTLQDTQKLVDYHKKLCENSLVFKESVKLAQTLYNRAVEVADKNIGSLREEITLIQLKIGRLQLDDKAKIHKDAMERIAMLAKAYEDGLAQLTKQYDTTVKAATAMIAQLQEQLSQKQAHLAAAQEHMQYKQAILDMRKKSNPGDSSMDSDTWAKANAAAMNLENLARAVDDVCCGYRNISDPQAVIDALGGTANCPSPNGPNSSGGAASTR